MEKIRREIRKKLRGGGDRPASQPPRPRTPGRAPRSPSSPQPIHYRRDLPRSDPQKERIPRAQTGPPVALEEAVRGIEAHTPDGGAAFVMAERVAGLDKDLEDLNEAFRQRVETPETEIRRCLSALWADCSAPGADEDLRPEDFIFLDLETTGLSNSPLFLIGAMVWEEEGLVVRQYFARDYAEERAVLMLFSRLAEGRRICVTFNGKSFDLPFLRARSAAHLLSTLEPPAHLDLLHLSRRAWQGQCPDCKLQTLERYVCGRARDDDIPGWEIPDAYHAFVHSGDATRIAEIFRHNLLDLVTMADLMVRLPQ